jgi:NADPH:quinone reductase-like Zn-dependent oxidoreductase
MRVAWYERQGAAREVLEVGELRMPSPAAGEVRVALALSGVNPGDIKKREGWLGSAMPYARVVPHSDGAGVIDAVGPGVDAGRVGRRVLVYGAQSYRPFGRKLGEWEFASTRPVRCARRTVSTNCAAASRPSAAATPARSGRYRWVEEPAEPPASPLSTAMRIWWIA